MLLTKDSHESSQVKLNRSKIEAHKDYAYFNQWPINVCKSV